MAESRLPARLLGAAAAVLAVGVLAWGVLRAQAPPERPEPPAWDGTRCERCGMLVSERGFAAQIQTRDGRVLHFDDPGGLLLYRAEEDPEVHAVWFHHVAEPRWIPWDRVAFERVEPTPMGYGLGARERGEAPGLLTPAEALAHAREREAARRGAP